MFKSLKLLKGYNQLFCLNKTTLGYLRYFCQIVSV